MAKQDKEFYDKFKKQLDERHDWPSDYMFKFIVPSEKQTEVDKLVTDGGISYRDSKTGKYVSVTFTLKMSSSDEVISLYKEAATIEGLMAL